MNQMHVAPPFPVPVTFEDVDAAILAREDLWARNFRPMTADGAWNVYLRKVLPPLPPATERRAS